MLKKWIVLPVLAVLVLAAVNCGGAAPADKGKPAVAPAAAGAAKVTSLKGFDMNSLKGKVTFVELWGVWCPPCIRSMPHIQETFEKYKSNKNFNLMVVNTGWRGDNVDKVKGWLAANPKYTFPVYFDDRPEAQQFALANQVNSIPRSLIFDKKGALRYNDHPGNIPADLLDKLLAE
jgi:cytochrome c-type biogenesis protein